MLKGLWDRAGVRLWTSTIRACGFVGESVADRGCTGAKCNDDGAWWRNGGSWSMHQRVCGLFN